MKRNIYAIFRNKDGEIVKLCTAQKDAKSGCSLLNSVYKERQIHQMTSGDLGNKCTQQEAIQYVKTCGNHYSFKKIVDRSKGKTIKEKNHEHNY